MVRGLEPRVHARSRLVLIEVIALLMVAASLGAAPDAQAAAITVQHPGARFDIVPTEGSERLTLKHVLDNSAGNTYPWETSSFAGKGYCVDTYGQMSLIHNFSAGAHSSGHTYNVDVACPAGFYAGLYRVTIISGTYSGTTVLEWDAEVPVTDPPRQPQVTVAMEGATFKVLPVAGSDRLKGTHFLGNSSDDSYPWETASFGALGQCVNPSGNYVQVTSFSAGRHKSGQTWNFNAACPAGTTAGRWRVYMTAGPLSGQTVLEWDAAALGMSAEHAWGQGIHANNPTGTGGDPVNTATGAYVTTVTDLSLPGPGLPFTFKRSYTSADSTQGSLGRGWTHSYAAFLALQTNGDIILRGEDGQRVVFQKQTDGSFLAAPGGQSRLTATASGYELTRRDAASYSFDSSGTLISITDRNGNEVALAYNADGTISTVTDSANRTISFTNNASGKITGITLPDGRDVSYGYTNGLLTTVTDVRSGTTTYTYDPYKRLAEVFDQNSNRVVKNIYAAAGRVIEQVDARGELWQFGWDTQTETSTVTDPRGKEWVDDYEGNVLISRTDPLGNETSFSYDSKLNVVAVTDAGNNTTTRTYDGRGNMLTRTAPSPLSYTETWTYNSSNDPLTYENGRGKTTSFGYDPAGNLTTITQPGSTVTTLTRDSSTGLVTAITDPRNKTTIFAYDTAGNLTSATTPKGNKTSYGHDSSGRVTSMVEARGNETGATPSDYTWTFGYDAANHLTSRTDPLGNAESWSYDSAGNLSSHTDQNNHETSYGHDAANNLTLVTAPDQTVTSYTYDNAGNLTSRTDANNHSTAYTYDDAGRLTSTTSPGNKVWAHTYDAVGNLKTVADAASVVSTFSYDEIGRMTAIDYSDSTPDVTFSYDANGNLTGMTDGAGSESRTYDNLDRLTGVTRGTQSFSYGYDAASNLTSRTYPDSNQTTYVYDDDSLMTGATQGTRTTSYGYDAAGRIETITLPSVNGHVETRTYDRAGRVTGVKNARALATLSDFTYTLDPAGNPTIVTGPDGTTTYSYDPLDRLKRACYPPSCSDIQGSDALVYGYDGIGNRTSETIGSGTVTYSHDADDRLTSRTDPSGTTNYSHDANGNVTADGGKSYAYDAAGRMTSATVGGTTTTYAFDGLGKRLSGTKGTDVTNFLWDVNHALPELAYETDGGGTQLRRYTYGASGAISTRAGGAEHYLHRDRMGSVTDVTGGLGLPEWSFSFGAFGEDHGVTQVDPLAPEVPARYTGQYLDDTGLYHLRARQYGASSGRFLSAEPLGHAIVNSYVSAYAYAGNMPTRFVDPSGFEYEEWPNGWDNVHTIPDQIGAGQASAQMNNGNYSSWTCAQGVTCFRNTKGVVPEGRRAITLGHFIFFEGVPSRCLLEHELTHVEQLERDGGNFLPQYLYFSAAIAFETGSANLAYEMNPYEVEASSVQNQCLGVTRSS